MFSIVIPSWNNLAYLKLCVESLKKYSQCEHEILVHLNDGFPSRTGHVAPSETFEDFGNVAMVAKRCNGVYTPSRVRDSPLGNPP